MDRELSERIFSLLPTLGKQLNRLAEYFLKDGTSPCFLNARQLACSAGVSPSTVVRFARRLGYDGYQSFKADLHDRVRNQLSSSERVSKTVKSLRRGKLLKETFERDIALIEDTLQLIVERDFLQAVKEIYQAATVYILGEKTSFAAAYFLYFRLSRLGINCKLIQFGGPAVFSQLSPLRKGDVLLALGFRMVPYEVVSAVKRARAKKITTIAITSPPASAISGPSDITLFVNRGSGEMIQSITPIFTLCHAIVIGVATRVGRRCTMLLNETDAAEVVRTASYLGNLEGIDKTTTVGTI